MPTWPSRIIPRTSSPNSQSNPVPQASPPAHRSTFYDSDRNALAAIDYNVPILLPTPSAAGGTPTAGGRRRSHARSNSQPFPSLMSAGLLWKSDKKVTKRELSDDETTTTTAGGGLNQLRGPGDDVVNGKCMTCNSTCRWPKHLQVFRCTICLMVNDLEHHPPSAIEDRHSDEDVDTHHPPPSPLLSPLLKGGPPEHLPSNPISIDETRNIIDSCLLRFLQSRVPGNHDSDPVEPQRIHTEIDYGRPETRADERSSTPSTVLSTISKTKLLSPYSSNRDSVRKSHRYSIRARSVSDTPPTLQTRDSSVQDRGRSAQRMYAKIANPSDQSQYRSSIFQPLEDYVIKSFTGCDCLNNSFMTASALRSVAVNTGSGPSRQNVRSPERPKGPSSPISEFFEFPEIDPKMLLLGDIAENSSWWMGGRARRRESRGSTTKREQSVMTTKSPEIDWEAVTAWYQLIIHVGENWKETWNKLKPVDQNNSSEGSVEPHASEDMALIEREIAEARVHAQRTLLKATENLLKRPRRPLRLPESIRFLLILLANPQLTQESSSSSSTSVMLNISSVGVVGPHSQKFVPNFSRLPRSSEWKAMAHSARSQASGLTYHSGIIKRILGLLGNLPNECHHYLVGWFAGLSKSQFEILVALVGRFVTYRLNKQHGRRHSGSGPPGYGLVPNIPGGIESSPAHLHAVLHESRYSSQGHEDSTQRRMIYNAEDWQIRAAARVMALLFTANNRAPSSFHMRESLLPKDYNTATAPLLSQHKGSGMILPLSHFYSTLLDLSDLVADFEGWESQTVKFSFCQYPFFLSIAAKSRILEYDARRQMTIKAREAFLDSILNRKNVSQYLNLKVRRDCLVEDSLRGVSEVIGSGSEDIKKSLRIEFVGEEGVDAGGLRKEWFLLLVREVFDPNHGLFVYDEDSQFCYFNPFCFESSEQFFLVGVLLGLAIYNSTILDIALPPFAFKKLLAAAPLSSISTSVHRQPHTSSLDDLAEYRPELAKGLRALLEFDGDVQETFCYDFVAQVERYGQYTRVPLCQGGESKPVTNANRQEFVSLYVHFLLDTAVQRQFEPFKRGFYTVCGVGNALALFRPEEIELMVRGSDEPLDVPTLRAVATYENWPISLRRTRNEYDKHGIALTNPNTNTTNTDAETEPSEPVVTWFWDFFTNSSPTNQRKLLSFITGSDRIPATGAASLSIRISCLGDDSPRFPIAHTCFNKLGLFRYGTREKLEVKLWTAICNSEGFGLK